jgi:hypothetical protein
MRYLSLVIVFGFAAMSQAIGVEFYNQFNCPSDAIFASQDTTEVCFPLPQSNGLIPLSISAAGTGTMLICLEPGCSETTPGSECQTFTAPFSCIDLLDNPTNTVSYELSNV